MLLTMTDKHYLMNMVVIKKNFFSYIFLLFLAVITIFINQFKHILLYYQFINYGV